MKFIKVYRTVLTEPGLFMYYRGSKLKLIIEKEAMLKLRNASRRNDQILRGDFRVNMLLR